MTVPYTFFRNLVTPEPHLSTIDPRTLVCFQISNFQFHFLTSTLNLHLAANIPVLMRIATTPSGTFHRLRPSCAYGRLEVLKLPSTPHNPADAIGALALKKILACRNGTTRPAST